MVVDSSAQVRRLARCRAEDVQFSRWLANDKVSVAEMMTHCGKRIRYQVVGRHVLAIQDTSEINYQAHAGRTKGLGTVGDALLRLAALAVQAATRCMLLVLGRDDETGEPADLSLRRRRNPRTRRSSAEA